MKFKSVSTMRKGRPQHFYCIVANCYFVTNSGIVMYDHLKIIHNFFDFGDKK